MLTTLPPDPTLVLFALAREAMDFLPLLQDIQPMSAPIPVRRGMLDDAVILTLQTGVGSSAMRRALSWLDSQTASATWRPRAIISAGFGGALTEDLKVGDVLQADEVTDPSGEVWRMSPPFVLPAARFVTSPQLAGTLEDRRRLARCGARVVDMESAAVARFCSQRGWNLACLRAISDEVTTNLSPHLVSLLNGSAVSAWKLTKIVLPRPWLLGQLWRLGRDTRLASRRLAEAVKAAV